MTSKEFAEALVRCVGCAEDWGRAAWSSVGGQNLKVEKMQETLLADGSTAVEMVVRVHTGFTEGRDEDGDLTFFPSETDRFTVRIVKEETVRVPMEGFNA